MKKEFRYELPRVAVRLVNEGVSPSYEPVCSPFDAVRIIREYLGEMDRETLVSVCLDVKKKPVNYSVIAIGTISECHCSVRELFKHAVLSNASCILIFHNHISGDVNPSSYDIDFTKSVKEAGKILGIPLVDHIIVTPYSSNYYSMAENGIV